MAELFFYEEPVLLDSEKHKDLRVRPLENAAFAAKTHAVPLTVADFGAAAHHYPILFAGESADKVVPMALLGLAKDENLFVGDNDKWIAGTYVPAFVRRYPFVPGEKPDSEGFELVMDNAYVGFGTEDGERLFNEDGSYTETLEQAIRFCNEYQESAGRTQQLVSRLCELDLLEERSISNTEGEVLLNGFFVINEEKLRALDKDMAGELLADGSLGFWYAHLLSLDNINRLLRLQAERAA